MTSIIHVTPAERHAMMLLVPGPRQVDRKTSPTMLALSRKQLVVGVRVAASRRPTEWQLTDIGLDVIHGMNSEGYP